MKKYYFQKVLSAVSYAILGIGSFVIVILGIAVYIVYYITDKLVALFQINKKKRRMIKIDRIQDESR